MGLDRNQWIGLGVISGLAYIIHKIMDDEPNYFSAESFEAEDSEESKVLRQIKEIIHDPSDLNTHEAFERIKYLMEEHGFATESFEAEVCPCGCAMKGCVCSSSCNGECLGAESEDEPVFGDWQEGVVMFADGSLVVKVVSFPAPDSDEFEGESMWVIVKKGNEYQGKGYLANQPHHSSLKYGTLIEYGEGTNTQKPVFKGFDETDIITEEQMLDPEFKGILRTTPDEYFDNEMQLFGDEDEELLESLNEMSRLYSIDDELWNEKMKGFEAESFKADDIYGVCPFCGYDAEAAVKYQMKQNDEELTDKEYDEEVKFYLYESHPDFCKPMQKYVEDNPNIFDADLGQDADTDRKKAQVLDKIMAWHDRMQLQSDSIAYELDRMDWMLENPDKDYDDYDDYAESFGAELNQKQLEALKRIREKRNKSSKKEDETKCPCGGDIVEALVCNHCLEVHRLYGAESFEADECSLHNCENNMVCDLCDCCEDHCFCGYCDNDKCYNSGLNATNNDYTPVGIDNLCEDGFCEWCHTTKSHPNLVNQGYVASPYCECHAFNAESFEAPYSDVACSKCGEKTNRGDWFNGGTSWACQPCQEKMKRENKGGECLLCKWREATEGEYERVVCVECSRYRTGRGQEEGYTEIDCGSCGNSLTATELMRCGGCGESMCGECPGDTQDCVGCAE